MDVAIRIGDQMIARWLRYEVEVDMLTPADEFSLVFGPARADVWNLCRPDSAAQVLVGNTPIVTGYIDARTRRGDAGGSSIHIAGRCKVGRLVDESMDLISLDGLTLVDLMRRVASPWFDEVPLSNAKNRDLVRGRGASKARAVGEPIIEQRSEAPRKVEPGETRWELAQRFLEPARLLAWGSGDGRQLVVGKPNYTGQDVQYRFFCPAPGSPRANQGNVLRWEYVESVAERYSQVTCVGASRGDWASYGASVTKHQAHAVNGRGIAGIGGDFEHRKILIVSDDDIRDKEGAQRRADREMAVRDASGTQLALTVRGHTQLREPGGTPAIYAPDTLAYFEDEALGIKGRFLVTNVRFEGNKQGTTTTLGLVPEGTELTS